MTSDLSRASQTARLLARETGLSVRVDARLRETGLGGWEGLTVAEVEAAFPEEWARWRAGEVVRRGQGAARRSAEMLAGLTSSPHLRKSRHAAR